LAVLGLVDVVSHLPRLLRLRKSLKTRLAELAPDMLIGIDSPDFNLGLEKHVRGTGTTTVHYVSPTIWAWRQGRVRKVAEAVDQVLCLFPFEPEFYRSHGVSAQYTGHPLADEITEQGDALAAQQALGLDSRYRYVALLPGSRRGEAEKLSPHLLGAAQLLAQKYPDIRFIAPMAGSSVRQLFEAELAHRGDVDCQLFDGRVREVLAASELVICASGTVTLEAMLINRPMVVVYRFNHLSYAIGRSLRLFKSRYFSLPNILANAELVPELVQYQVNAQRIFSEAVAWLEAPQRLNQVREKFSALHAELRKDAANSAADCVQALLEKS
jgi:lipid-A-disaccharide synthase